MRPNNIGNSEVMAFWEEGTVVECEDGTYCVSDVVPRANWAYVERYGRRCGRTRLTALTVARRSSVRNTEVSDAIVVPPIKPPG